MHVKRNYVTTPYGFLLVTTEFAFLFLNRIVKLYYARSQVIFHASNNTLDWLRLASIRSIQSEEDGLNIGDSPSREYKFGG